jgi:hypothetical protein
MAKRNDDIESMKKSYTNKEGYTKFQIHDFIEIFGTGSAFHLNTYFTDINLYFLKEQLKELE